LLCQEVVPSKAYDSKSTGEVKTLVSPTMTRSLLRVLCEILIFTPPCDDWTLEQYSYVIPIYIIGGNRR
jgi:hypothetical protein